MNNVIEDFKFMFRDPNLGDDSIFVMQYKLGVPNAIIQKIHDQVYEALDGRVITIPDVFEINAYSRDQLIKLRDMIQHEIDTLPAPDEKSPNC